MINNHIRVWHYVIPKFHLFRSISNRFCVLKLIFFIIATFQSFWPDFCPKLIRASFKYIGCSYILNCFLQPLGLYCGNEIVFKVFNTDENLIIANNILNRPALLTISRIYILLAVSEIVCVHLCCEKLDISWHLSRARVAAQGCLSQRVLNKRLGGLVGKKQLPKIFILWFGQNFQFGHSQVFHKLYRMSQVCTTLKF